MPSVNDGRATQAIERYVRAEHPADIDAWRRLNPSDDWGMEEVAWRGVGRRIIRGFNQTEPVVVQIDPASTSVDNALRNLHKRPLGEFHQYIVDKADGLRLVARFRGVERRTGEVSQ